MNKTTSCKVEITDLQNPLKKERKKRARKENLSAYFITINTNQVWKSDDPKLRVAAEQFAKVLKTVFNNKDQLLKILNFNTMNMNKDYNSSVSEWSIELGPNSGMLHAHGLLEIKHQTQLQLGYRKAPALILFHLENAYKEIGVEAPKKLHFHAVLQKHWNSLGNDKKAMLEYIRKNRKFDQSKNKQETADHEPQPQLEDIISIENKSDVKDQKQEDDIFEEISDTESEDQKEEIEFFDVEDKDQSKVESFEDEESEGEEPGPAQSLQPGFVKRVKLNLPDLASLM